MPLMTCPHCAASISSKVNDCPKCSQILRGWTCRKCGALNRIEFFGGLYALGVGGQSYRCANCGDPSGNLTDAQESGARFTSLTLISIGVSFVPAMIGYFLGESRGALIAGGATFLIAFLAFRLLFKLDQKRY